MSIRFTAAARAFFAALLLSAIVLPGAWAQVCNVKVLTDASPDYSDMDSLVRSVTGNWQTPEEKMWAMFYWNHVGRRQTSPMILHGTALTDPIRQFNDYGYTMCSTISGINCAIWDAMGYRVKYWDITNHTVAEVEYNGRWHMYDSSLSALYTLCDGKTIAGVADIGATGGCAASGGKVEPGHIAKYHCLNATSSNGFLTGSDTARDLDQEYRCFNPNGLKHRPYFNDWDRGHRYILNLRPGESYTRHYNNKLGATKEFYVPNHGKNPEDGFEIRGNGIRTFSPKLTAEGLKNGVVHAASRVKALPAGGIVPAGNTPGVVTFKVEGANVITSLRMRGGLLKKAGTDAASVAISTTNGLRWQEVAKAEAAGETPLDLTLTDEVNGSYEVLVRVTLRGQGAQLKRIAFDTTTMVNRLTQPQLRLGKNIVYVGTGDASESTVLWPDLRADYIDAYLVDKKNLTAQKENPGYQATLHAEKPNEEAYAVFRLDAPRDITRLHYGGRLYNRANGAHIDFLHSFDGGKTWQQSYSLTDTKMPWDVIHYETVNKIPAGTRSVLVKYRMNASEAGQAACGLYAVRMEASYKPADATFRPLEVTFTWKERQKDFSLVERSHTQAVNKVPFRYAVNVGGEDHPVVESLRVNGKGALPDVKYGYSDGHDAGGEKFVPKWMTVGKNLAEGKKYTLSLPSETNWEAGDPDGTKLTDGIVGPSFAGGTSYRYGALWGDKKNPVVTLDLGAAAECASFGMNFHGYPWHDALKGEVKDTVEVLVSDDGTQYRSLGFLNTNLRRKDIPVNFLIPDRDHLQGATFRLIPEKPVRTRFVQYRVTNQRVFALTEMEVLDRITLTPYDLRVTLPDEKAPYLKTASVTGGGGVSAAAVQAQNTAAPVGEPVLERPTLHSLGAYWIVRGDENRNAQVQVSYRRAGTQEWKPGMPFFRVEKNAHKNDKGQSRLDVPEGAWLLAGSVVLLSPDTEYELRLRLTDPDNRGAAGAVERILKARTKKEPVAAANAPQYHVMPGDGGGDGSPANPYKGLAAAHASAKPGDIFLLHPGSYTGTFEVTKSGAEGKPIIWRGMSRGDVVIDGKGDAAARPGRAISAVGVSDVWFENLMIRNADYAIVAHRSTRIVVRRCLMNDVTYGLTCTTNDNDAVRDFFITDNVIEGPSTWPRTMGIEEARAIQVTGEGHVVAYNRIRGFADAIDTFGSQRCASIDFHNNDISQMTDDGIEMDYSERNTRCFNNRLTDVFQGISVQPIYGGPVYIFRNAIYNIGIETFKMHNKPSGALMFHNTSVKKGMPLILWTSEPVRNSIYRNNLFIGTPSGFAYETTAPMENCDFDYDGFGGGPFQQFLKWNGARFNTWQETREKAPVYRHVTYTGPDSPFVSGVRPPDDENKQTSGPKDLRLKPGTAAIDAGLALPNFSDGFKGKAPDLGAFEEGAPLPHYGPRS